MIGGALFLIAAPLAAAVVTFALRRFLTVAALLATLVPLALAVVALQSPPTDPQEILGRTIALGSGDRIGIAFLFVVASAIFVGVWRSSPGWNYYPVALLVLGSLAAALIIRPPLNEIYPSFIYSTLFVAIAATLTVFPLQGGKPGVTRGVQRFLTIMILALPALLLADWTMGQLSQSPDSVELQRATIFLVALGFTFLLAIFPFHSWVPGVAREAPPMSTAFVLNVLLPTVLILLLDVLNENRIITRDASIFEIIRGAGLLMAGLGAVLSWTRTDFGHLLGYGAIVDVGAILYAIGLASSAGLAAAFVIMIVRSLSIGLMAMGMALVRERLGNDSFLTVRGLVWRLPWASLALVAGSLSLAGLPPLAGFAGRWGLLQETSVFDPRAAAVLLAAGVSVAIGVLRGLRQMLHPSDEPIDPQQRERRSEAILIVAALAVCLFIGLFPGVLSPVVREFVAAYTFVSR